MRCQNKQDSAHFSPVATLDDDTGGRIHIPQRSSKPDWSNFRVRAFWRVQDGEFAEHWDELNLLEVFQQLGVIPALDLAAPQATS